MVFPCDLRERDICHFPDCGYLDSRAGFPRSMSLLSAQPLVIAHRGASGYRPEHTLAAYQLAMELGADYVEPDLVSTRDGVLVARHESEISRTTDVALQPAFANRFTTKIVHGLPVRGWFTEDFTLDELKTLRVKERMPRVRTRNRRYDGLFDIPTFDEVLDLVDTQSRHRGEVIGVCPEIKRPSYFESIGLGLETPLVASLKRHHLNRPNAQVLVQSFEAGSLRRLRERVRVPLVQLVQLVGAPAPHERLSPPRMREIATYADALGAAKDLVLPRDGGGRLSGTSDLVGVAHEAGLGVLVWTLRHENRFMARDFRSSQGPSAKGDPVAEHTAFFDAGVDGVFTDNPDTAVAARASWHRHSLGIRTHATR